MGLSALILLLEVFVLSRNGNAIFEKKHGIFGLVCRGRFLVFLLPLFLEYRQVILCLNCSCYLRLYITIQSVIKEIMMVVISNMLKRYSSQIPVLYSQLSTCVILKRLVMVGLILLGRLLVPLCNWFNGLLFIRFTYYLTITRLFVYVIRVRLIPVPNPLAQNLRSYYNPI